MLISEFARAAGLSVDTVRFYIRKGLIAPATNGKGGRNPYQVFTGEHVRAARVIRMAQSLGLTLREIAALTEEHRAGGMTRERSIAVMSAQLARLRQKAAEVAAMTGYLEAKIAWLEAGAKGPEPDFSAFFKGGPEGGCDGPEGGCR